MKTTQEIYKKRLAKLNAFFWQVYSALLLRFTALNNVLLESTVRRLKINKLHVGCGHVLLPGWLNITFDKSMEYGRIIKTKDTLLLNYNLLEKWPFPDESIDFIAASHFIEHFDLNAGINFTHKCFQIMKRGGTIRLSCPDLEIYARNYVAQNSEFFAHPLIREWCTFENAKTPGEIFIAKAYDSGSSHKWFYDFASLKHILEKAGFTNIIKVNRTEGKTPNLNELEPLQRELETLYVEALKP